jgi:hypothetical protein
MVTQVHCPVCASEEVYSLLNTLHCKRCGNIWTEEKKTRGTFDTRGFGLPACNRRLTRAAADSTEQRMERQLEGYLKRSKGKFSMHSLSSTVGDIQMAMFRRYLKKCIKNKILVEKKDRYGITWYSRPD